MTLSFKAVELVNIIMALSSEIIECARNQFQTYSREELDSIHHRVFLELFLIHTSHESFAAFSNDQAALKALKTNELLYRFYQFEKSLNKFDLQTFLKTVPASHYRICSTVFEALTVRGNVTEDMEQIIRI